MRARILALILLTLVAGWFRFSSTDFGLPDKYRPDEEYLVSRALGFRQDWNPHFAVYPALHMYVQHAALRATAWAAGHEGDFRAYYAPGGGAGAHLAGRRLSALLGTLTVPALYLAGARTFGAPAALAAATILAFAPIHVRESKYATTDAATVLWITLVLWMMFRVIRLGRIRDSLGAGLLTGLAIATKYPAGALLGGVAAAHLAARRREGRSVWRVFRDIRPYVALYATIVAFLCGTPYFALDWKQTVEDFEYQRGFVERGVGNSLAGYGWTWILGKVFPDSLGLALAAFLIFGLLWSTVRPRPGSWSVALYIVIALAGMAASHYSFYRYVLIPLPGLVLLAGVVFGDAYAALGRRLGARRALWITSAALALLLFPSVIRDYKLNRILARPDTRTLAREWIEQNVPAGVPIAATDASTPYGKPQLGGRHRLVPLQRVGDLRRQGIEWVLSDTAPISFYSPGPTPEQLAELERDAELVFDRNPIKPGTPPPVFDQADAFYAPLQHASSMTRPGPWIRVWRLHPQAPPPAPAPAP
jgi:4-amino-4-deoxy-L-arabinose transferase-like glycosyltransferase